MEEIEGVEKYEGVLKLRDALIRDISTQAQEKNLYRLLLEPVMKEMPHLRKVKQFIICPGRMLALVPFEILLGPAITKRNLLGMFSLTYSEEECGKVADALLHAGYEVVVLSEKGENGSILFSRAEFLHCMEEKPVSIIHVLSHGFYIEQETMPPFMGGREGTGKEKDGKK